MRERFVYVLQRMREDDVIDAEEAKRLVTVGVPALVAFERPRRDSGFHFIDQVAREARTLAGVDGLTAQSYTVRSTIIPQLQRAAEAALQEGLARYEIATGRVQAQAAEANLGEAVRRIEAQRPVGRQAGLAAGADQCAAAALRRALAAGGGGRGTRAATSESAWPTAGSCR